MTGADVRVRFEPEATEVLVPSGTTLLDAAHAAGVTIDAPCGGVGKCGACRVAVSGDLSPLTADEVNVLGGAGVSAGKRLACRARATGDVIVTRPRKRKVSARIVARADVDEPDVEPPVARGLDREGAILGAAVDIGTTTVAVWLVDLRNGDILARAADLNAQRVHGDDVLSRVSAVLAGEGAALQSAIAGQVGSLVTDALGQVGAHAADLAEIVCCGNTAMTAILLGRDVAALAAAPYEGAPTDEAVVPAPSLGMLNLGDASVHVLPGVSAFIGSDITSGLLATRLAEREGRVLFADLGTNGEIVLRTDAGLIAASAAAGPALEGASIECGMRAETGAIERVERTGERLALAVIGDVPPAGICGSGLLDLVACLLDAGVLDSDGLLRADVADPLARDVIERGDQRVFVVGAAHGIVLTQRDVRQVQLALAAVRVGIDLLLAEAAVRPDEVDGVVIGGGFGLHLEPATLVRVGLVPGSWAEALSFAGNTALAGARAALVSSSARERAREIARAVRTVDLAAHPEFQQRFISALAFPS